MRPVGPATRLRDQIADFAVTYIASEEYRKNNGDGE